MKSLGIQGKLCVLFMMGIVIFSVAVCVMVYTLFSSYQAKEITQFRQYETKKMEQTLRNNVLMAHSILARNYEQATDRVYLEQEYGPRLVTVIDIAESIIRENMNLVRSGQITRAQAQKNAQQAIAKIRYDDGSGYIWINDTGTPYPQMIMHPVVPQLAGKLLDNPEYNCAQGQQKNLFQAAVEVTSQGDRQGFVDYLWPKPNSVDNSGEGRPKLSYVRRIPEWNWIVGTGIYVDEAVDEAMTRAKEEIRKLHFNNDNVYFWINDISQPYPRMVMHPLNSELDGKILDEAQYNLAGGKGLGHFQKLVHTTRNAGEGYANYVWPRPPAADSPTAIAPKLSFVKRFDQMGWLVGTDGYTDEIENSMQTKIEEISSITRKLVYQILFFSLATLALLLFVFRLFTNRLLITPSKRILLLLPESPMVIWLDRSRPTVEMKSENWARPRARWSKI